MPIQEIKYYPEDIRREHGSLAIKLPMNNSRKDSSGGVFNLSYTTEEQAVSNYINLLLTMRGERYMQPTYGVGLQRYLFEPNTEDIRDVIETAIYDQANFWLPYIINQSIDVIVAGDVPALGANQEHGIQILIKFKVTESGANRLISIFNDEGDINVRVE